MLNLVCMGFRMIDDNLIKRIQSMIGRYEIVHPQLVQELLGDYIKLIEQNAELHKELAKRKAIIEDVAALGFLTPSHDSGKSHRDVCEKFDRAFLDY